MKLSAPKKTTFYIALVLLIVGVITHFIPVPILAAINFWLVVASAALLLLACSSKGL